MLAGPRSARHGAREDEQRRIEGFRLPGDVVERRRRHGPFELADEDAGLPRREALDRRRAEARREESVEGARRAAALHVPKLRDAQVEAEALLVVPEVLREHPRVVARPLGHDNDRVFFAALARGVELLREVLGARLHLGNDDRLGSSRDSRHEREVPAVAAHDLDEERPLVGGGRDLQAVDRFERDVEGRVDADRDVRARQVVVDRGGDAHNREPGLRERVCPHLRAAAADDDEAVDAAGPEDAERLLASDRGLERVAARAPEDRSALLDDAAHVPRAERRKLASEKSREAVAHAKDAPTLRDPRADDGADRRVHARRVASARQDGHASHPASPSFPAQAGAVNGHSAFLRAITRYATTPAPRTARPVALNPLSGERNTKPQRRSATSAGSG